MNIINPYDPDILENNIENNMKNLNILNNENNCKYSEIDKYLIKDVNLNNMYNNK